MAHMIHESDGISTESPKKTTHHRTTGHLQPLQVPALAYVGAGRLVLAVPRAPGRPTSRNTSTPISAGVFIAAVSDNVMPALVLGDAEPGPVLGALKDLLALLPRKECVHTWRPVINCRRCRGAAFFERIEFMELWRDGRRQDPLKRIRLCGCSGI